MKNFSVSAPIITKRGFTLIIALTLMALIALLVVTMSSFVSQETKSVGTESSLQEARTNAKLALMVAIGDLQHTMGPDKRASARADLFSDTAEEASFWTGVWHTDPSDADFSDFGGNPRWLVSGRPSNEDSVADGVTLLNLNVNSSEIVTAPNVVVPREPIVSPGATSPTGHFAFWISDESLKASIANRDRTTDFINDAIDPAIFSEVLNTANLAALTPRILRLAEVRRTLTYRNIWRRALETFIDTFDPELNPTLVSELQRLYDFQSVFLLNGFESAPARGPLHNFYHDITVNAYGVLANSREGGLRINLTDPTYTDSFVNQDMRSVLDARIWDWEFLDHPDFGPNWQGFFTEGDYPDGGIFNIPLRQGTNTNPHLNKPVLKVAGSHNRSFADGQFMNHQRFIMTEFGLFGAFIHNSSNLTTSRIPYQQFQNHIVFNVWNPYSSILEMGRDSNNWNNGNLLNTSYVIIHRLPEVEITPFVDPDPEGRPEPPVLTVDMNNFTVARSADALFRSLKPGSRFHISGFIGNERRGSSILYPGSNYRQIRPFVFDSGGSTAGETRESNRRRLTSSAVGNRWYFREHEADVPYQSGARIFGVGDLIQIRSLQDDYRIDVEIYPWDRRFAFSAGAGGNTHVPWNDPDLGHVSDNPLPPYLIFRNVPFEGWNYTIPAEISRTWSIFRDNTNSLGGCASGMTQILSDGFSHTSIRRIRNRLSSTSMTPM